MNDRMIAVRTDRSSPEWWTALYRLYPRFALSLANHDCAVMPVFYWGVLARLPGWAGPPGAETPIVAIPDFALEPPYDTFEVLR